MTKNWFLVDGERMLLTEEEAEGYDGDGYDVVAENTIYGQGCKCVDDVDLCAYCLDQVYQEIPYE